MSDPQFCLCGCGRPRRGLWFCAIHERAWNASKERQELVFLSVPQASQTSGQKETIKRYFGRFIERMKWKRKLRESEETGRLVPMQMLLRVSKATKLLQRLEEDLADVPEAWAWTYQERMPTCPGHQLDNLLPLMATARKQLKYLCKGDDSNTKAVQRQACFEECEKIILRALEIAGPFFDKTPDWRPAEFIAEDYYAAGGDK